MIDVLLYFTNKSYIHFIEHICDFRETFFKNFLHGTNMDLTDQKILRRGSKNT